MEKRALVARTYYLSFDQVQALTRYANEMGTSQASLVRRGVDMVLNWAEERMEIIAAGEKALVEGNKDSE